MVGASSAVKRFPLLASATILTSLVCALHADPSAPADFTTVIKRDFGVWDTDHDGLLSSGELDAAINDCKTSGEDAAAAAALKRASSLTKTPPPVLTLDNIVSVTAQKKPDLESMYRQGLKRISSLADRTLFPPGQPSMDGIHQGKVGNCFCLAPLGALVHRDPAKVSSMFSVQPDGSYCVRFGNKSVVVPPPTDAEIAIGASNANGGLWLNLYEKAVGTARNEDRPADKRVGSPLDAERGGSAGAMLTYITGHPIVRFSFAFAHATPAVPDVIAKKLADLRAKLAEATQQQRLMTCGTVAPTTPGLTPNHAYAVLSYDAQTDAVRLWNPHGQTFHPKGTPGLETGYVTQNGVFDVPVDQFVQQFSGMAFENTL